MGVEIDWIKSPLNGYTFRNKPMRNWVERHCEYYTLNAFAGMTKLNINEYRIDKDKTMLADWYGDILYYLDVLCYTKYDTILLDPPYSYRKAMEMYNGNKCSQFKRVKDQLADHLNPCGCVITFGYHSVSMGRKRGFEVERIAIFSHGGAIHDTIATKERYVR